VREIESSTYLQCCGCGKVHTVRRKYNSDEVYIDSVCPKCGHERALILGEDKENIYVHYDPINDDRYFIYK
jgi:hypothetical protein